MAYHNLEPFGDELTDIHLATIAAILANANRKKGSQAQKVDDFRLWKPDQRAQGQEFFDRLKSWAILTGEQ